MLVSGDLAVSRLIFIARLVTGVRATNSLTWHRSDAGWRIKWDHTTSYAIDAEALAVAMDTLPGQD